MEFAIPAPTISAPAPGTREKNLLLGVAFCSVDVLLMGAAAWVSDSLAILSDLLKESTDFLAVLASYFTVLALRQVPGQRFAYGIGKLENLVSLAISLIMVGCSFFLLAKVVAHFHHPMPTSGTVPGIVIFTLYAAIGFGIWTRNRWILRQQHSPIIESQARLWFSKACFDSFMATALTLELVFRGQTWSFYLDPLASLLGVAFMIHAAYAISSSSVNDLMDAALEETTQLQILNQLVRHIDDYDRLHKVRSRRSGSKIFVEVFLEFPPSLRMAEAQERIQHLRQSISSAIPGAEVSILPHPPS
jgi:cation diffusion facilitator family transporter